MGGEKNLNLQLFTNLKSDLENALKRSLLGLKILQNLCKKPGKANPFKI